VSVMRDKGNTAFSNRTRQTRAVSAQQDHVCMLLKQIGADVEHISGLACAASFDVSGTELKYAYILGADDAYFLYRVRPYPMSAGMFSAAEGIVEYIERDVHAFRNAAKSNHFPEFLEVNRRLTALVREFEEAFMCCNIPETDFEQAKRSLEKLERLLHEIRQDAKPL
jgi:hypothetical protein